MLRLLPLAAAALLGAAPPPPAAPDVAAAPDGGVRDALRLATSQPEAPPPEAPGGPVAEAGVAHAVAHAEDRTWFALPMLFWLPETKLGFAGSAGLHFRLPGAAEPSNAFVVVGYTLEDQGSVDLSSDFELRGGTLVSARFRAVHYPDSFYGIGPESSRDDLEEMTRRFVDLTVASELSLAGPRLRAGPRVHARAEEITEATPGGLVATDAVEGSDGFTALGLGLGLTWDSRDRPLWPGRGSFAHVSYLYYPSSLGRNDGFGRGSAEGRLFLPLGDDRVLGLAALLERTHGATPFSLLSKLGSTRYLRGVREGRFRDQLAWAAQAEVRVPLAGRVFATAFGAFGDVGEDFAALSAATLKVAGGAGLRYRLTDQGANLRLDVAAGQEGPAVYVLLLEAF